MSKRAKDRCQAIAYKRVSTDKQGRSGLGLEAQDHAIEGWLRSSGCKLIATYEEVESGKLSSRPELTRALAHCRRVGATLVVAKLDRLSRNLLFLLTLLQDAGDEFDVVFCDMPTIPKGAVGRFMISNLASAAELERGLISERTKAALAAYKARGGTLGTNNLTPESMERGRKKGGSVMRERAVKAFSDLAPTMRALRESGSTYQAIADRLNADGHTTRSGSRWSAVQVRRVLDRA